MTEEEINQAVEASLEERELEIRVVCLEAIVTAKFKVDYQKLLQRARDQVREECKKAVKAELKKLEEEDA